MASREIHPMTITFDARAILLGRVEHVLEGGITHEMINFATTTGARYTNVKALAPEGTLFRWEDRSRKNELDGSHVFTFPLKHIVEIEVTR